jgi:hypothetical protein
MAFDIYQQVFDRDGLPLEKKAEVRLSLRLRRQ